MGILLAILLFSGEIKLATAEKIWIEQYEFDLTTSGSLFEDYQIPPANGITSFRNFK